MIAVWSILLRHLTVFRRTWFSNVTFNFIEPFLYLSAMGLGLGSYVQEIEGVSYMQFIAPGMVASSAMWAATFECTYASFIRLHFEKTFHAMLASPVTIADIVLGEMVFAAIKSVVFGLVILAVITAWGLVPSYNALYVPFFLALPGTVFAILALSYTGITPHIDYLNYYITLFITPLYLFSGIFFPVTSLPGWVQALTWVNPLYHSVEVCRTLVLGHANGALGWHIAILCGFALLLVGLPIHLFKKRLIQ
jgi:lipooligosaccharide transport system permease protein